MYNITSVVLVEGENLIPSSKFSFIENSSSNGDLFDNYFKVQYNNKNQTTKLSVYYVLTQTRPTETYSIYFTNQQNTLITSTQINSTFIPTIPAILINQPQYTPLGDRFQLNYTSEDQDIRYYEGGGFGFTASFPFCISGRTIYKGVNLFQFRMSNYINQYILQYTINFNVKSVNIKSNTLTEDKEPPFLEGIEIINVDFYINIIRIHLTDNLSGIHRFTVYGKNFNFGSGFYLEGYSNEYIVKGTNLDGVYEIPIDITIIEDNKISIYGFDMANNAISVATNTIVLETRTNPYILVPFTKTMNWSIDDFTLFGFKYNEMDTTNEDAINYLFFNVTEKELYIEYKPKFAVLTRIGLYEYNRTEFFGEWDSNLKVFIVPFYLPKKSMPGLLSYEITTMFPLSNNFFYGKFGPDTNLLVVSDQSDLLSPVISAINEVESFVNGSYIWTGWRVIIDDDINGFSDGYFEIRSNIDWQTKIISFNESNLIGGDKTNGLYSILFPISVDECISQNFTISKIHLNDFNTYPFGTYRDPIFKWGPSLPMIQFKCDPFAVPSNDTDQPSLVNISVSRTIVDVGSNDRWVTVLFETQDPTSPISLKHDPYVYIQSIKTKPIGFQSTNYHISTTNVYFYNCTFEIPFKYGQGEEIAISLYGITDIALNVKGYSFIDLQTLYPNNITIIQRQNLNNGIYLKKHYYITKHGGPLKIEGYGFDVLTLPSMLYYTLNFNNGTNPIRKNEYVFFSSNFLVINIPPFNQSTFTIQMDNQGVSSNILVVVSTPTKDYEKQTRLPIHLEPTPTPSSLKIDPDFSILTDYDTTTSSNPNSICYQNNSSSLSKSKIAAIVVCSTNTEMESIKSAHLKALERFEKSKPKTPAPSSSSSSSTSTSSVYKHVPKTTSSSGYNSSKSVYMSANLSSKITTTKTSQRIIYDVVNYLKTLEGVPASLEEIKHSTGHEIEGHYELIEKLKTNPKVVSHDNNYYSFKPLYNVKNQKDILELLSSHPNGILVSDLAESYTNASADVKKLKESKEIFAMKNTDSAGDVIFPNDERFRMNVSKELIDLWKDIKVPNEADLEREMKEAGLSIVESSETTKITKAATKQKKERKRRTTKLTNTHIENFNPNETFPPPPKKE
eukprot:gene2353-2903_t